MQHRRRGETYPVTDMPNLKSRSLAFACLAAMYFASPSDPAFARTELPAYAPDVGREAASGAAGVPEYAGSGLDADLIYSVLVAEIAARRGDMATAFTHYFRAAEQARDAKMAELAVKSAVSADLSDEAERGIRLWTELSPDSVSVFQVAAFLRIRAGDREGALVQLSRVVELAGKDGGAGYAQAAGIIARAPSAEERVALMTALVDLDPDSADAQQALAMVAASAARPDVAVTAARRALELRPDWSAPRIFLVRLLISEGRRGEARTMLEEFIASSPEDHALGMLYGQFLVEEQEFTSARSEFERLLRNQPKEPDVLFAVGILSLQLDDIGAARSHFTRLFETGERGGDASFYLGQVEERAENRDAAIGWYEKVTGGNASDAQVRIAVLRAKGGDVRRAREMLQQLRDQSPDDAVTLFLVEAEILDQVGRPDEALAVYDEAVQSFPGDPDLLYSRALFAVKLDRIDRAEADLRQILIGNPDHADALNALGYTLADRTDRYQEAARLIERAYQLKPEEPAVLDSMGWISYRLGDHEAAVDYLRRALAAMSDGEIAAHLGEVLWAMGRHDEAWAVWDEALKSHPEHSYLLDVVGRHRVTSTEAGR